jgi:hypothetical protein
LCSCRYFSKPSGIRRLHNDGSGTSSLIVPDSISLERSLDGATLTLSFETNVAVDCKLSSYPLGAKPSAPPAAVNCANKSATKFTESISGLSKDKLMTIVLKTWATANAETTATSTNIDESTPVADNASINLLSVDLGASRIEFTTINSSATPSSVVTSGRGEDGCWLSSEKSPGLSASRKAALVQGMSSRGFINAVATRVSPTTFSSSFQSVQRQSTEWSLSAKTASGFGQLRFAKPTMLTSTQFAGQNSSSGLTDRLEDIDPPGLKLLATATFVTTWVLDGDNKNATATLTIAPSGSFSGITCRSPAATEKITVPATLVAKIPGNIRLWSTLRIDSWQALEKERWIVRVSDWSTMGIQRL